MMMIHVENNGGAVILSALAISLYTVPGAGQIHAKSICLEESEQTTPVNISNTDTERL